MDQLEPTLLIIPLLAVLAPLIARSLRRVVGIPIVVFELMLGILVGPSLLGWAVPSEFVEALSEFGLAMLFFVAGSEIEFTAFRGRTGRAAIFGWVISLTVGVGIAWLIAPGEIAIVIGIALCSTALGTLLPILRDTGELHTPFGRAVGAVGAVGEFGPLIAISIFLGASNPGIEAIVLVAVRTRRRIRDLAGVQSAAGRDAPGGELDAAHLGPVRDPGGVPDPVGPRRAQHRARPRHAAGGIRGRHRVAAAHARREAG